MSRNDDAAPRRWRIHWKAETASTQLDARAAAERLGPDADGLVFLARRQTAGRGTRGRSWYAPPGRSLPLSFVWCPHRELPRPAAATLAAAVAVVEAAAALGARVRLEWPNDVVSPAGGKVAGVLAEAPPGSESIFLIGIGVNVLPIGRPPFPLDPPASSLRECGGRVHAPQGVLLPLLASLTGVLDVLERRDPHRALAWLAARVRSRHRLEGRIVRLWCDGRQAVGRFRGPTPEFEIYLEGEDGSQRRFLPEHVDRLEPVGGATPS